MLLESLVSGIGVSVSKSLVKLWLKDHDVAADLTSSISGLLIKKIPEIRKRNNTKRTFEKIGEHAAEIIANLIKKEAPDMTDQRLAIVANAAGETLVNTQIDIDLLVKNKLSNEGLLEHFLSRTGAQGGHPALAGQNSQYNTYSPTEQDLYRYVLNQAAQLIVDMSSSFPHFDVRVNAELLSKVDNIAEKVIEGMNLIAEKSADKYESNYRNACVRKHDQLELFGVDLNEVNKRYNLSVAYVTLMVENTQTTSQSSHDETLDINKESDCAEITETRTSLPAHEALLEHSRLFVRAPAGAGKTTLLQWYAVFSAARQLEDRLEAFNDYIPFFIKLRNCTENKTNTKANFKLPDISDFARCTVDAIGSDAPPDWIQNRLEEGKAIIMIDGLDEVAEDRRNDVKQWLGTLIEVYPNARYVVTSRPHAAEEGWLDKDDFVDAELHDMAREDVYEFIDHWHDAVAEGVSEPEQKDKLSKMAESLKKKLSKNPAIHRLATSPLLCALLCALHKQRVKNLPHDRLKLYEVCIDMFLRRDEEREIDGSDYINLDDKQMLILLRELAWWMILNKKTTATPAEVSANFNKTYGILRNKKKKKQTGQLVTNLFLHRIGIIRQLAQQKIDFPHKTFQEYLAAQAAVEYDNIDYLVNNAHDDQWREVCILSAGLFSAKKSEELLKKLLKRGADDDKNRQTIYMVAIASLDIITAQPSEDSRIYVKVKKVLDSMIPPKDLSLAKDLASAGDLAVPYLTYKKGLEAKKAQASIRTLACIGSELAIETLSYYTSDSRKIVQDELVDSARYTANFLSYIHVAWMNFTCINLSKFNLTDYSFLSKFTSLININLSKNEINSLAPLESIEFLEELNLSNTQIIDITPLKNLKHLKKLDLDDSTVTDISPLSNLTSLEVLSLYNLSIENMSALASLTSLVYLRLSNTNITDFSTISNFKFLEALYLSNTKILEISPLNNLKKLEVLYLTKTSIRDISSLSELKKLEILSLDGTGVEDITPLAGLTLLEHLSISNTKILDISILENLKSLNTLNILNTNITDFSPLKKISKLRSIRVSKKSILGTDFLQWASENKIDIYQS